MEDTKIVELYWQRDQAAIGETEKKYGGSCRSIAYGIHRRYSEGHPLLFQR